MKDDVQTCKSCGSSLGTAPIGPNGVERSQAEGGTMLTGRILQVSRLATIGEMASGIAHELNQPLAAIANYAQASVRLMKSPALDMADIQEALEEISAQAQRAGDIIRRMRSLARDDEAVRVPVDGSVLIQEIFDLLQADARVHGAQLSLRLQRGLPRFLGDPVQIQHVVLNLVRNAMEAVALNDPAHREVVLGTQLLADGQIELYVSDNGPGMTQNALDRLFEPFFTTKPNGTGLGLAISNTIVRAHGGEFGHRSNLPTGACFYLRIPPSEGGERS